MILQTGKAEIPYSPSHGCAGSGLVEPLDHICSLNNSWSSAEGSIQAVYVEELSEELLRNITQHHVTATLFSRGQHLYSNWQAAVFFLSLLACLSPDSDVPCYLHTSDLDSVPTLLLYAYSPLKCKSPI